MKSKSHLTNYNKTIDCIKANLSMAAEGFEARAMSLIELVQGDPSACARSLSHYAQARAMLAWIEQDDLLATRQQFYLASKLMQLSHQIDISQNISNLTISPGPKNFELLNTLVSNNREQIDWFTRCDAIYDMKYVEKINSVDFLMYQSIVALRGEWSRLIDRCEKVIANPPASLKKWHDYHYFYLALAQGDKAKMEEVLATMVAQNKLRTRVSEEYPFTENLIFSRVIIGMKIAWLHGFEVHVDSPYVPMEWMPMTPLDNYDNYYSFLK